MADPPNDFISLFHSLEGDTISDRKRNFNKLLRNPAFVANKQSIHDALDKLKPKTYLESLFKIDALIYFRYTDRLFEVIKEGNEVFISKILKQYWFFEEVFRNMDAKVLVNDFLPNLSLAMRMKVLKKLSVVLDENKMDDIYDCLYERYGLFIATKFLHTCTEEKLKYVLNNEEIKLAPHQVLHLFKRNSGFFEMYVDYYKKTFDKMYAELKVIKYVAEKEPKLLVSLVTANRILVNTLGRRTSKKVILSEKDVIIKNYDNLKTLFNKHILIKKLPKEFKLNYLKEFPEYCFGAHQDCMTILRFYPKNKRYNLFVGSYLFVVPAADLNTLYIQLGNNIMSLNPTRDVIVQWARCNYDKTGDEEFLKYFPTSESIALLKEKINLTSDIGKRKSLILFLIETCKINSDLKSLEEVLNYVCYRHRNEDPQVKNHLLSFIQDSFDLETFNQSHWKYVMEMIQILDAQNQFQFRRLSIILCKYLEYLEKHGESWDVHLSGYLKQIFSNTGCFSIPLENQSVICKIIKGMIEIYPKIITDYTDKGYGSDVNKEFIIFVLKFVEKYPDYFIDLGESVYLRNVLEKGAEDYIKSTDKNDESFFTIMKYVTLYKDKFPQCTLPKNNEKTVQLLVECCLNERYDTLNPCIKHFILKKCRNTFENELLNSYFEKVPLEKIHKDIVYWFLTNEPQVLIPYFKTMCEKRFDVNFKLVKLLSHLGFDDDLKQHYIKHLESKNLKELDDVLDALQKVMPTNEFVDLIDKRFAPSKSKSDLENEEAKLIHIQLQIAKKLHKVQDPLKMLPVVLKFLKGDYRQSSLPAFYSIFYRSPEKELYQYINQLSKKEVSVRKHGVFLSCELLNQKHVLECLSMKDDNLSRQGHLFKAILKYFIKNPSEKLFELTVKNMSTINAKNRKNMKSLVKYTVPKKYKILYVEKCWEFYENLRNSGIVVDSYLEGLLGNVSTDQEALTSFTPSFVFNIIDNYVCETFNSQTVLLFIVNFLVHTKDPPKRYIEKVLKNLKTNELIVFIDILLHSKYSVEFVNCFIEICNEHFDPIMALESHLIIKLFSLRFNSISILSGEKTLAEDIVDYLHELIETFSLNILVIFNPIFRIFLSFMETSEEYTLLHNLIEFEPSSVICLVVLSAMKPVTDNEDENFELYQSSLKCIKKVQDPTVRIAYKQYLLTHYN